MALPGTSTLFTLTLPFVDYSFPSVWVCIIFTSLLPLNWSQEEEVINIYSLSPLTTSQGPSEVCNADIKVSGLVLKTKASDFKGKRVVVGENVSLLDLICPPGPYTVTYKQHGTAISRLPLGSWMTCPPVPLYSTGFASKWFMISALYKAADTTYLTEPFYNASNVFRIMPCK